MINVVTKAVTVGLVAISSFAFSVQAVTIPVSNQTFEWGATCADCLGVEPLDTSNGTNIVTGVLTLTDGYIVGNAFTSNDFVSFAYNGASNHVDPFIIYARNLVSTPTQQDQNLREKKQPIGWDGDWEIEQQVPLSTNILGNVFADGRIELDLTGLALFTDSEDDPESITFQSSQTGGWSITLERQPLPLVDIKNAYGCFETVEGIVCPSDFGTQSQITNLPTSVNTPASFAIFGLGMMGLALRRSKKLS